MIKIREAERADCLGLIKFLQLQNPTKTVSLKLEDFERDGFDKSSRPLYKILIAEELTQDKDFKDKNDLLGFILYIVWYAVWEGKCLHIEEFIVSNSSDKVKDQFLVETLLLKKIAQICIENELKRVTSLTDISLNGAVKFFEEHGAINYTKLEGWHNFMFNRKSLEEMAQI